MQEAVQVAHDVPTPRARPTISAVSRERASAGQPHAFGFVLLTRGAAIPRHVEVPLAKARTHKS